MTWWEAIGGHAVGNPVLVVEDEPATRQLLTSMLELAGFTVEAVRDGGEALSRLLRDPLPSLLILDIMMPVIDGLTILRWVTSHPRTAGIPVVMASAKSDPLAIRLATVDGAAGFISKPFSPDEALKVIAGALGIKECSAAT
jgi:CheY-like chemotaxis protein